jgi:23S rRNA pseudouridine1911/1915/1917 synthase
VEIPKLFQIIYEDPDLLVINKPAGLVCHPTKTDQYSSLIGRVRIYLGTGCRPHLVNRLDRETSGLVIVGKKDEAARELRILWENHHVKKVYWAIVHGSVAQDHGVICAATGKDEASKVAIKDCVRADGAPAETEFWVEQRFFHEMPGLWSQGQPSNPNFSLLRVAPRTGRKHQIRIHLAHIGHSIVGDKLYGADENLYLAFVEGKLTEAQHQQLILPFHALHAFGISFSWKGQETSFKAQAEEWFNSFLAPNSPE